MPTGIWAAIYFRICRTVNLAGQPEDYNDLYKAKTPVLDEFREESVTLSRAFCPSPHCCPRVIYDRPDADPARRLAQRERLRSGIIFLTFK